MNRDELLDVLETVRSDTMMVLDVIPDEVLATAVVRDGMTPKDLIAHLTAWESELVTGLFKLHPKQAPRSYRLPDSERDRRNAKILEENKDRLLDRVMGDFQGVRRQLMRQVERLKNADLTQGTRYNWLGKNQTLIDFILTESVEHEAMHIGEIEEWWAARQPD